MNRLSITLKKQRREIERLKKCKIYVYKGFGKSEILVFDKIIHLPEEEPNPEQTQINIEIGYYSSIERFDAQHTADIEFEGEYLGPKIKKYRHQSKLNLISLGKHWRKRVTTEYPDAELTIVVHNQDDEWFLDTFNYNVNIDNGIFL